MYWYRGSLDSTWMFWWHIQNVDSVNWNLDSVQTLMSVKFQVVFLYNMCLKIDWTCAMWGHSEKVYENVHVCISYLQHTC